MEAISWVNDDTWVGVMLNFGEGRAGRPYPKETSDRIRKGFGACQTPEKYSALREIGGLAMLVEPAEERSQEFPSFDGFPLSAPQSR